MKKIFGDNGVLTEEGKRLLMDFRMAIDNIMSSDAVADMSSNELSILQSNLYSHIGTVITNRVSLKLQRANEFNQMTDEQFHKYLDLKYGGDGPEWLFQMSLTPEEMDRAKQVDYMKGLAEALEQGRKDKEAVEKNYGLRLHPSDLWFKGGTNE